MIRLASLSDLEELMKLEEECFGVERFGETTVTAFLVRDDAFVLVACDENNVVGAALCLYSQIRRYGRIASVAVREERRRKGFGIQLVESSEERMASAGIRRVGLEVDIKNLPATGMYLKCGYVLKGIVKDYYGTNRHAYALEKDIGPSGKKVRVRVS